VRAAHNRSGPRRTPPAPLLAARKLIGAVVLLGLLSGCGGDDDGDVAAFCEAVEDLRADDPFEELQIASPGEMRDAFADLAAGVDRIADAAPEEARSQAQRYAVAVEDLRDELAGAGYDPTRVDQLDYGQAVAAYTEGAVSVDNAADALC
jgi:type VI protein secretion system component VasF